MADRVGGVQFPLYFCPLGEVVFIFTPPNGLFPQLTRAKSFFSHRLRWYFFELGKGDGVFSWPPHRGDDLEGHGVVPGVTSGMLRGLETDIIII